MEPATPSVVPGDFRPRPEYALTRTLLLQALGAVYAVGFLIVVRQHAALIGSNGLLPAAGFLERVAAEHGSSGSAFWLLPSLFWLGASDAVLATAGLLGLTLSLLVCAGFGNALVFMVLWALYLSFVHVGQIFYGYGWESLLCEAGFLAIFLSPPWVARFSRAAEPPASLIVLFRWLVFRVMFGAGLIKLRGDPCWLELSCLETHYETQPNPNPLSPWFHALPPSVHRAGVVFNHAVELVAPFFVFGPRRARLGAGAGIVVFQLVLILSGNLSFLNWLTLALALACFDDAAFRWVVARWLARSPAETPPPRAAAARAGPTWRAVSYALAIVIAVLSLNPITNLLSSRQAMNASYDPFRLVNTYGAFGSVGERRHEVVFEGTRDTEPGPGARWVAYEFPCKPGDPARRPCWVSPYHHRLDWQLWFLAFGAIADEPWAVHLVYKLLNADSGVRGLLARDPFGERPPRFVRARYYRYRFSGGNEPGVWQRELVGEFMQPVARDAPELTSYLRAFGLLRE